MSQEQQGVQYMFSISGEGIMNTSFDLPSGAVANDDEALSFGIWMRDNFSKVTSSTVTKLAISSTQFEADLTTTPPTFV